MVRWNKAYIKGTKDIVKVQRQLRHSSLETVAKYYIHIDENDIADAMQNNQKFDDVLKAFESIQKITNCSTGCGGCHQKVLDIISFVAGIFIILSMWVNQKMNNKVITNEKGVQDKEMAENSQAAQQSKTMLMMMPLMSIWFGFILPVGLSFYWICNNVLAIIQDLLLNVWVKKELEKKQNGENK